ncbi:SNF2 family N-terminal domain-containing protein [Schizophyllum amplum]|uniref:SNF2 family N-terminal domain-containing protein n=1 Tax=Schizophyllum amplum TaxID=97359 RepID=A0A550BTE2_9AGAR|nr:SNF2 family N-terminal domain-containing protein [Auriculariopsis ampla]
MSLSSPMSTSADILKLAKKTLGLPDSAPDRDVPWSYLDELRIHLSLYPTETNFRVTLEPNLALGAVTCLHPACNGKTMKLIARFKALDGGLSDGLGSLSIYRDAAAITEIDIIKREVVRRPISVEDKDDNSQKINDFAPGNSPFALSYAKPLRLKGGALTRDSSNSNLARRKPTAKRGVKPEPTEAVIPRKRPTKESSTGSAAGPSTSNKRLKTEPSFTGSSLPENAVRPQDVEDIRAQIEEVAREVAQLQRSLQRLRHKSKPSKAEQTRMLKLDLKVKELNERKQRLSDSLPNLLSLAPTSLKRTNSRLAMTPSFSRVPTDQKPVVLNANPFPGRVKPEPIRAIKPEPVSRSLARMKFSSPAAKPVASGSNVRLPSSPSGMDVDTDTDDDDEMPESVVNRYGQAIPQIAPVGGWENYDAEGNFHGRGRDLFEGPQAKADDIEKFLVEAGNSEQFESNATVDEALKKLGLPTQYQMLPGMQISLMAHQVIGVAWMVDRERSKMKGGCLADEMGLGKTVQMISTMVFNRSKDKNCKTTLIVAPVALLSQWALEIEMKTNCGFECVIYHGNTKPRSKKELLSYDVVLTTYGTLANEWPDWENEMKKREKAARKKNKKDLDSDDFIVDDDSDDEPMVKSKGKSKKKMVKGLLFQVDWYRVVLDEGQNIRNRRTRVSRAVTDLETEYRWVLSGTPIINGLQDPYGMFRFLKLRPWHDVREYQSHIGLLEKKNPTLAVSRVQTIFRTCLLRRMKNTKLDGKPLIELPEKVVELTRLMFSEEERSVYSQVETRTQNQFNRYLRAGTVLKNYQQVLVLLLRLRQCCVHPCLIQEGMNAFVSAVEADVQDPEVATELNRALRKEGAEFVQKVKDSRKEVALARIAAEKESEDATVEQEECPICFDNLTDVVITKCMHVYCEGCIHDVLATARVEGEDEKKYKADERPCPTCRAPISKDRLYKRSAFEPTDDELNGVKKEEPMDDVIKINSDADSDFEMKDSTSRKGKGKAKAVPQRRSTRAKRPSNKMRIVDSDDSGAASETESDGDDYDDDDISDFIVGSDEDEDEKDFIRAQKRQAQHKGKARAMVIDDSDDEGVVFGLKRQPAPGAPKIELMSKFLPSTKMKYMMDDIERIFAEKPDEKVILVSQWTTALGLLSDYLSERNIAHVKYQGDMNRNARDAAVRSFMAKDKAKVMLMSLKCGGVGLNLTRANNVISLDLGWSEAVEAQAFDRVHRLGQTRKVLVKRLVVDNTVEDRILSLQERKALLADGALGEGKGKKIGRLSVKELANLFGLNMRGERLRNDD